MPLPASLNPDQFSVTWVSPGAASMVPFEGAVVSRMMEAEYGTDVLPHWSLNQTYTVFTPLPDVSVQLLVAAKAAQLVQLVLLLMHICIAPRLSSAAVRVSVADLLLVASAALLIVTDPVGGFVSGTGLPVAVAPDEVLPALSMAHTRYP